MPDHDTGSAKPENKDVLDELESNLIKQLEKHRMLERCVEQKHQAIRLAHIEQVTHICEEENEIVQSLGELEKARLVLTGTLTELNCPDSENPLTISQIADIAGEERGMRLRKIRAELNKLVIDIRKSSSVVRLAMEKLNQHMIGIKQIVHSALSRAGVYGSRGQVALGAQLEFNVDIKS